MFPAYRMCNASVDKHVAHGLVGGCRHEDQVRSMPENHRGLWRRRKGIPLFDRIAHSGVTVPIQEKCYELLSDGRQDASRSIIDVWA